MLGIILIYYHQICSFWPKSWYFSCFGSFSGPCWQQQCYNGIQKAQPFVEQYMMIEKQQFGSHYIQRHILRSKRIPFSPKWSLTLWGIKLCIYDQSIYKRDSYAHFSTIKTAFWPFQWSCGSKKAHNKTQKSHIHWRVFFNQRAKIIKTKLDKVKDFLCICQFALNLGSYKVAAAQCEGCHVSVPAPQNGPLKLGGA